ncbi:MAG: hypothetical protein JNK95_07825 [Candidatus Competibacter sp.]|nr:hypothetical protein [Candidatus Competibacter sp.]MDG4606621.1 hypothetical protein [Candidatus Contendobacter sp.]
MTRRISGPAQRARRLLSQATMQRSHRRGELIRLIPESEHANPSATPSPSASPETELTGERAPSMQR